MRKRVALFGGSFDPIHFGHLNLALSILEKAHLDEVLFCPAHISPFKKGKPPQASPEDRLEMVACAIHEIDQFSVLDFEVRKPAPSYTIDTVRFLKNLDAELHLILGEDSLAHLSSWKEIEELLRLAPPLIGTRTGKIPTVSPALAPMIKAGLISTSQMEISSTEIRTRLREGRYCGHLVPAPVLTKIRDKKLYNDA